MYVVYRRKGLQDTPVSCFEDESEAQRYASWFRTRQLGDHFVKQEEEDSHAVQRLRRKNASND